MKIALLGYGRMGKAIALMAKDRGHEIVAIVDPHASEGNLEEAEVAINFSIPDAAVNNIRSALALSIPVVSGTTGWLAHKASVDAFCLEKNTAFLYASNFSIGVNLFFALNSKLAQLMGSQTDYKVKMEEIHHIHKLDAPSGTAISLAEAIIQHTDYQKWALDTENEAQKTLPIKAIRDGEVPGTHSVVYQNNIDSLSIRHEAFTREGFALGAVIAAEWILDKKGIFDMKDVLNLSEI